MLSVICDLCLMRRSPHIVQLSQQQVTNFTRFGMALERLLRKQQLTVDGEFEDAALARYQLPRSNKEFDLALA